jgi:hypothetical protein
MQNCLAHALHFVQNWQTLRLVRRSSHHGAFFWQGHIANDVSKITDRFDVKRPLDKGTFGAVFQAWDSKHK